MPNSNSADVRAGDSDRDRRFGTEDNCPDDANPSQTDSDSDSAGDVCDVDDDGDGLIEIGTHAEFNAIRYSMAGTSLISTMGGEEDSTGCGGQAGISSCSGYELTDDISLASYPKWVPIGGCVAATTALSLLTAL